MNWDYTPVNTDANGCITAGPEDRDLRITDDRNIALDLNGCSIIKDTI